MKAFSDSQLIQLYQNGNEKAIEILISRHQKEVFSSIFYKILDEDLANDIFQETFMKAIVFLKENRYKDEGKFGAWLKRISQNLIIDYYRAKNRKKTISEISHSEQEYSIFDFIKEDSDTVEERLIKNQILEDLNKMPTVVVPWNKSKY
jgi:RNA polymerase sigma factor (sigma-70 family)